MINVYRNKVDISHWYNYYLDDGKNKIGIIFLDNGDLYFSSLNRKDTCFCITKDNMIIYNLFNELYNDFKYARVFKAECSSVWGKDESIDGKNNRLKSSLEYKQLFCNNTITWISDDSLLFDVELSNSLRIIREDNIFKLVFTYHEDKSDIRICNSGSRYTPFNIIMMNFFNKLQEYDPEYHQIDLEEYQYIKQFNK